MSVEEACALKGDSHFWKNTACCILSSSLVCKPVYIGDRVIHVIAFPPRS